MTTATTKSLVFQLNVPLTGEVSTRTQLRSRLGSARRRATDGSLDTSTRPALHTLPATMNRTFKGISRHGIAAAGQRLSGPSAQTRLTQAFSLMMASTLIGLGVSLFVRADFGVPAYDVMLTGLRDQLGVSLGQAGWIFTGILLLIAASLGQRVTPTGIAYILANGVAVDTFLQLLRSPDVFAVRLLFVGLGTMSIAVAIALVLHAGFSGGAIELLMRAGKSRGLNPFQVRTAIEISIVLGGVVLGGDVGPATIVFVATISPVLRIAQRALDDHRAGRQARLAEA